MSFPLALLLGCALFKPPAPAVPTPTEPVVGQGEVAPVSFAPLEERVNVLIAEAIETDRRDRLVAARELMVGMRNKQPEAQQKVYAYLDEVLKIEERARSVSIPVDVPIAPIEEEPLETPTPTPAPTPTPTPTPTPPADNAADQAAVAAARTALAEARYLDAVSLLATTTAPEAAPIRKEAVDGWARSERERAGHVFLEARQLPPGNEKITTLRQVRKDLAAINERFPDNAYAQQIKDNVAKVDADLAQLGVKP